MNKVHRAKIVVCLNDLESVLDVESAAFIHELKALEDISRQFMHQLAAEMKLVFVVAFDQDFEDMHSEFFVICLISHTLGAELRVHAQELERGVPVEVLFVAEVLESLEIVVVDPHEAPSDVEVGKFRHLDFEKRLELLRSSGGVIALGAQHHFDMRLDRLDEVVVQLLEQLESVRG